MTRFSSLIVLIVVGGVWYLQLVVYVEIKETYTRTHLLFHSFIMCRRSALLFTYSLMMAVDINLHIYQLI
jgi:hypothetical protein